MAAANYRARVTIPYLSGQPSDVTVNDFTFRGDAAVDDLDDVHGAIIDFYLTENTATGHQEAVAQYFSEAASRAANAARIDIFQIGTPGPPISTETFTLPAAVINTGELPQEVAACLSFRGSNAGVSAADMRHRRGRVFLGPLDRRSGEVAVTAYRPSAQFQHDVVNAAFEFLGTEAFGNGWTWGVWSPTAALFTPITVMWMDDAYDTMRSRGCDPTSRFQLP